jgi:hypothetical protein
MVARSVFERLEASGFRELKVHLTEEASAHAFAAAVPVHFTASIGYGRGERRRAGDSHALDRGAELGDWRARTCCLDWSMCRHDPIPRWVQLPTPDEA